MYSPKIREDLIPALYKLSKFLKRPMTSVVNQLLEQQLKEHNIEAIDKFLQNREINKELFLKRMEERYDKLGN